MITSKQLHQAINVLLQAAPAGSEIILFGSQARNAAREASDADFLVIEPTVRNRRGEMVRLRQVLRPLRIPADIVVVSRPVFEEWKDAPNTLLYEAAREGKVYAHSV